MSKPKAALGMGVLAACFLFLAQHDVGRAQDDGAVQSGTKTETSKPVLKVLKRGALQGKEADASPADRILAALDSRVQVNFADTPLREVCKTLSEQLKIPVVLDYRALDDMGIAPDTPITGSMKDVRLASWLDFQFEQLDLTWIVRHEVLLVTTVEQSDQVVESGTLRLTVGGESSDPTGTAVYDVSDLVGGPGCPPHDMDQLMELITTCIEPTTWNHVGGPAPIVCLDTPEIQALVIPQSRRAHGQIAALLSDLRTYLRGSERGSADPPPSPCSVRIPAGEAKLRRLLAKKIDVNYIETPLNDVIEGIENRLGAEIELHRCSMDDMGISPDTPITLQVAGVSAAAALDLLLSPLDLTFTVQDDFLVVLADEEEEANLFPRVYDVSDLVGDNPAFASLIQVITTSVRTDSWNDVGGPGAIAVFENGDLRALTVRQTWRIQLQIEALLARLRTVRHEVPPSIKRVQRELKQEGRPMQNPYARPGSPSGYPVNPFGAPQPPTEQPEQGNGRGGMGGGFF